MIKVKKVNNTINISGHANYCEFGHDIVCASVSSIITTIVNCIMNLDKDSIIYQDNGKMVKITKINNNQVIDVLLNTMLELLKDLEKQYKQNIKVESEE